MPAPEDQNQPINQNIDDQLNMQQSLSNKIGFWLKRHYLALINIALAIYLFLPLLAPVLMKTGHTNTADVIYRLYKPLCHQLAYRSFFLFGEQLVYPLELAGIEGLSTFEEVTGLEGDNLTEASAFRGNEQVGYKTAMCQRDIAIYASLLLFGLLFSLTRARFKPLPWFAWILLALGPLALDGVSQLISQMDIPSFQWFAMRESTPFLRILTGAMFGWFTAWFGLPSIEEMVNEGEQARKTVRILPKEF